jgi:uncharacterized protein (DUF433 family)
MTMGTATLPQTDTVFTRPPTPPVSVNPARMSGQAVIGTSRVPVGILLDYVDREALQRDFPSLDAELIERAIQYLKEKGEDGALGEPIDY